LKIDLKKRPSPPREIKSRKPTARGKEASSATAMDGVRPITGLPPEGQCPKKRALNRENYKRTINPEQIAEKEQPGGEGDQGKGKKRGDRICSMTQNHGRALKVASGEAVSTAGLSGGICRISSRGCSSNQETFELANSVFPLRGMGKDWMTTL